MKKMKKLKITLCSIMALSMLQSNHEVEANWIPKSIQNHPYITTVLIAYTALETGSRVYAQMPSPADEAKKRLGRHYPTATKSLQALNDDPNNPFVCSFGISDSQTSFGRAKNTCNYKMTQELFDYAAQIAAQRTNKGLKNQWWDKKSEKDLNKEWKHHKDRNQYPTICNKHQCTTPYDQNVVDESIKKQLKDLGVYQQKTVTEGKLPPSRLSIEWSDVCDDEGNINQTKIDTLVDRVSNLGFPLLFFHHYANPAWSPYCFEHKEDCNKFTNYCVAVVEAISQKHPEQTLYVCPMNQPMGFANRVSRGSLPPFIVKNCDNATYFNNIVTANVKAAKAMKEVSPNIKTMLSHQWKPMKPAHKKTHWKWSFDNGIATIADQMYNQAFVKYFKPYAKHFDVIALSVYPTLHFDGPTSVGSNCDGRLDPDGIIESLFEINQHFPDKEILIVETGCNTKGNEKKLGLTKRTMPQKEACSGLTKGDKIPHLALQIDQEKVNHHKCTFIDMTLHVCKVARDVGIPVNGCYFWGVTNDPTNYAEWNTLPGSTNFAPFNDTTPESITAWGQYLKNALGSVKKDQFDKYPLD